MPISSRSKLKFILFLLSVIAIGCFSVYAFRGLLFPPSVTLLTISDGMHVPAGMVLVEGTTKRVDALFVQGKQITRSPKGDFDVEVAVFPPYTIIEIEAKDIFNKTIHKTIRLSVEE